MGQPAFKYSKKEREMNDNSTWEFGTRQVVYGAIGAALYGALSWVTNFFPPPRGGEYHLPPGRCCIDFLRRCIWSDRRVPRRLHRQYSRRYDFRLWLLLELEPGQRLDGNGSWFDHVSHHRFQSPIPNHQSSGLGRPRDCRGHVIRFTH